MNKVIGVTIVNVVMWLVTLALLGLVINLTKNTDCLWALLIPAVITYDTLRKL